jgi:hypothetical protein
MPKQHPVYHYQGLRSLGRQHMILEGVVTTLDAAGAVNVAPMGPRVAFRPGAGGALLLDHFVLRPFSTSRTFQNLTINGEGVLHVTDDVLLLARAAIGPLEPLPLLQPARKVRGMVLADCCRWYEFRIVECDDSSNRAQLTVEVVYSGRVRDFFGLNRARHAVVEAAILATRVGLLPAEDIADQFHRLEPLITKTGGPAEHEAFALLCRHVGLPG